ncbi:MAG: PAS domain S-box protein [Thioploca sp.]|nr:PAS domain S-box protein [Thioploca sp.]
MVSSVTSEQLASVYQAYLANTDQLYPSDQMPLMQALLGKSTIVDDMEIHHSDRIIPLEVHGTPIFDETGKMTYAIMTFQDITERLRQEQLKKVETGY